MIGLVAAYCFIPFIFFCWFMECRQKKGDRELKARDGKSVYTDVEKDPYLEYGEAEVEMLLS